MPLLSLPLRIQIRNRSTEKKQNKHAFSQLEVVNKEISDSLVHVSPHITHLTMLYVNVIIL